MNEEINGNAAESAAVVVEGTETTTDNLGWESIPEDLRNSTELKAFEKGKTPALAKSYIELSKSASGKVKIPTDKSTPEEVAKFNLAIGVPEKADGYKVKMPELTEQDKQMGITFNPEAAKGFLDVAHKAGYTNTAAQTAIDYQMGIVRQQVAQQIAEVTKLNDDRWTKLKGEWGDVKTTENIELTKRAFNEFAPEELKEIMTVDDAVKDPILVKMYSTIWRKTMNDTLVKGDPTTKVEFVPKYTKSPAMYATMNNEEGIKARAYFESHGYSYATGTQAGK